MLILSFRGLEGNYLGNDEVIHVGNYYYQNHGENSKSVENWDDSTHTLEVSPTGFPIKLNMP